MPKWYVSNYYYFRVIKEGKCNQVNGWKFYGGSLRKKTKFDVVSA